MLLESREVPADKKVSSEMTFVQMRRQLDVLAKHVGEHCGLPMMIDGEKVVIEPSHRAYEIFQEHNRKVESTQEGIQGCRLINTWWSSKKRTDVVIWREPDGRLDWGESPAFHHIGHDLRTMACSVAWSLDAEMKAQSKLSEMLPDHLFRGYVLTGMFIETSKHSGVTYVFRRLRPTVATKPDGKGGMRILACLCMHPIGYYAESWAGSLCPTDDVISHLLLMRGDEKMFWRRANQIPPHRPEAGL